jgi:hypothetical protein
MVIISRKQRTILIHVVFRVCLALLLRISPLLFHKAPLLRGAACLGFGQRIMLTKLIARSVDMVVHIHQG